MGIKRRTEYTRHYRALTGIRAQGGDGSPTEGLAMCENMYRDWSGDGDVLLESVPGYRRVASLPQPIRAIYLHPAEEEGDCLYIHAGDGLYRLPLSGLSSGAEPTLVCSPGGEDSRAFTVGESLYLLSGGEITRLDRSGVARRLFSDEPAYVPTLFVEGERYEERNLLTDSFTERRTVTDGNRYAFGTKGLRYAVTDESQGLCAVVGADPIVAFDVHIPSRVELGGLEYRVTEIADGVFDGNIDITSVRIAEGVERIGSFAFFGATGLVRAELPSSLREIGAAAFSGCGKLSELYIKTGLELIGAAAFASCPSLKAVCFSGSESEFSSIDTSGELTHLDIEYGVRTDGLRVAIPVLSDCASVESVVAEGESLSFKILVKGTSVRWVLVDLEHSYDLNGKEVVLTGKLRPYLSRFGSSGSEVELEGRSAVLGCRVIEAVGSRVFLSGNPSLPNTVFYTAGRADGVTDPTYVGESCYFNDGVGGYPVTAILAVRDTVAVFKAGDDGSGSIFYHRAEATGEDLLPTVYPVTEVHSGIGAYGAAMSFLDDPVFTSPLGVTALSYRTLGSERSLAVRSEGINQYLQKEAPCSLALSEWQGYLVLGGRGRIYLGDSRSTYRGRSGDTQYDWFCITGVGSYENSTRVYRYASLAPEGYLLSDTPDEVADGEVYSEEQESGESIYYIQAEEGRVAVYPTEELRGGDFSPAVCYLGVGEHLIFGTESGVLSVFNLDRRGVPPDRLLADPGFDPVGYEARMGRRIHPDFYSFDGHAPRYSLVTHYDDCGMPHLSKSTVRGSLVIDCRRSSATELHCEVGTDRARYRELSRLAVSEPDFSSLDLSTISFAPEDSLRLCIGEHERRWVEKQITLYSDRHASPIGVSSISYRYTVSGGVKSK